MVKYLGIVGPSGCGKTTLMHNLINNYPSLFTKVEQCTTRSIRDNEFGDAYVWLNRYQDYKKLEHLLIAKTEVKGNYYGSIPLQDDDKIGIIILNELGLDNFVKDVEELNKKGLETQYYIVGLDKTDIAVKREGRDEEYVKQERKVLDKADIVYILDKNKYADPEIVMKDIMLFFDEEKE